MKVIISYELLILYLFLIRQIKRNQYMLIKICYIKKIIHSIIELVK